MLWNIANLQFIVAGAILILADWRCRFPKYWFSFMFLMLWFRSSLLWFLAVLCSFIFARMRLGLNTQLRTYGYIAQFWWQIFLGRFAHTMQTCKSFKGLSFFKRTFFCWGPSGRRPKVRKNASKVQIYPSSLGPSEPKVFFKTHFLFTSVSPSVKTGSAVGTTRSGRVDVLKPCVYSAEVSQGAHVCPRSSL